SVQITAEGAAVKTNEAVPEKFKKLVETVQGKTSLAEARKRSSVTRLIDLSKGAVASQSSDFEGTRFAAKKAIDGNLGTFSHTDGSDPTAWWQVDLEA